MSLSVVHAEDGFELYFKNRRILTHSDKKSCIHYGNGESRRVGNSVKETLLQYDKNVFAEIKQKNNSELTLVFDKKITCKFRVYNKQLTLKINSIDKKLNRLKLFIDIENRSQVYGCGLQFGNPDLRGKKIHTWINHHGIGRRWNIFTIFHALQTKIKPSRYSNSIAIPSFVTADGLFVLCKTKAYTEFNFRNASRYSIYLWEVENEFVIGVEKSFNTAITALSDLIGRQPAAPDWLYDGLIFGSEGGIAETEQKLLQLESAEVPVSTVWLKDWTGFDETEYGLRNRHFWEPDKDLYPEISEFFQRLRKKNIRSMVYITPFLSPGNKMFAEAEKKGFLMKNHDGSIYFVRYKKYSVAVIDILNKAAKRWLRNIVRFNLIELGISGWYADASELLPFLHESEHTDYYTAWAELNKEALDTYDSEPFYFCSSTGGTDSLVQTPVFSIAGQTSDWSRFDGLAGTFNAMINAGFAGIGNIQCEIGGYWNIAHKKRSPELLMRWIELAAFSQSMFSIEGSNREHTLQFTEHPLVLRHLRYMTNVFRVLKPYHQEVSKQYRTSGYPAMRIIPFHYPDEFNHAERWKKQYLYGSDLLVAPVFKPNRKKWKVHLPDDTWVHLWSGKYYKGNTTISVFAPPASPPVFYRAGSKWNNLFSSLRK